MVIGAGGSAGSCRRLPGGRRSRPCPRGVLAGGGRAGSSTATGALARHSPAMRRAIELLLERITPTMKRSGLLGLDRQTRAGRVAKRGRRRACGAPADEARGLARGVPQHVRPDATAGRAGRRTRPRWRSPGWAPGRLRDHPGAAQGPGRGPAARQVAYRARSGPRPLARHRPGSLDRRRGGDPRAPKPITPR